MKVIAQHSVTKPQALRRMGAHIAILFICFLLFSVPSFASSVSPASGTQSSGNTFYVLEQPDVCLESLNFQGFYSEFNLEFHKLSGLSIIGSDSLKTTISGTLKDFNPKVTEMKIIVNGSESIVPVAPGGKFSLDATYKAGLNIIYLQYNGRPYYAMSFAKVNLSPGKLRAGYDEKKNTILPYVVAELGGTNNAKIAEAKTAIIKRYKLSESKLSYTAEALGQFPITKDHNSYLAQTKIPTIGFKFANERTLYMAELKNKNGETVGLINLNTPILTQVPSKDPELFTFISNFFTADKVFFSNNTIKYGRITTTLNKRMFTMPRSFFKNDSELLTFTLQSELARVVDQVFVENKDISTEPPVKVLWKLEKKELSVFKGQIKDFKPSKDKLEITLNGQSYNVPLDAKGAFNYSFPLTYGYHQFYIKYKNYSYRDYIFMGSFERIRIQPQFNETATAGYSKVPIKINSNINSFSTLPVTARLDIVTYPRTNTAPIITNCGVYNLKDIEGKSILSQEAVDVVDFLKTYHDINGYMFQEKNNASFVTVTLLDAAGKPLTAFTADVIPFNDYYDAAQKLYRILYFGITPSNVTVYGSDKLGQVREPFVNGLMTLTEAQLGDTTEYLHVTISFTTSTGPFSTFTRSYNIRLKSEDIF